MATSKRQPWGVPIWGGRGTMWGARRPQVSVADRPPPGTYDPAIDIAAAAAHRGFGDVQSDYTRDWGEPGTALGGRQGADFTLGRDRVNQSSGRSLADLLTSRTQAQQDHDSQIQGLDRRYAQLGNSQGQRAAQMGASLGGALAQAAAKRAANETIDRAPVDTALSRYLAGNDLAQSRLGEDTQSQLGDLTRTYSRGGEDAATALARAGREDQQFGLDSRRQAFYSADVPLPLPSGGPSVQMPAAPPSAPARRTRRASAPRSPWGGSPFSRGWGR